LIDLRALDYLHKDKSKVIGNSTEDEQNIQLKRSLILSTDSIELRGIELAKIECARKHFECLGNETIRFEVVDSYDTLMEIATQ